MAIEEAAREALDLLGLEEGEPTPRAFEELFLRFQHRVPFRRGPSASPPGAEGLLRRYVAEGRGGRGKERRAAFVALARHIGHRVQELPARGADGSAARALVARLEGRDVLAGVDVPLPVIVPLEPADAEIPSALGTLRVAEGEGGRTLLLDAHGATARLLTIGGDDGREEPEREVDGVLLRFLPDRVLRWSEGRMEIADPWSRLCYGIAGSETGVLEALFDQPVDDLTGVPACEDPPELTVFHEAPAPAAEVLALIATAEGVAALLPPGLAVRDVVEGEAGWSWTVDDEEGAPVRSEAVTRLADGVAITTTAGEHPVSERRLVVRPAGGAEGASRLVLTARLSRPVPPAGPNDSVRRTLVFHLAAELLALALRF